jgi:hypothetical protein
MMVDIKICVTSYKFCSFKLNSVIYQNPTGYAEPVYNALHELNCYFLCDICHWHSFHPFGECINNDE